MANRGEQELAREVDGLPVVVLVLVGVREQRDARALHPFGRGVLAQCLAHLVGKGLGLELGVGARVGYRLGVGAGVQGCRWS